MNEAYLCPDCGEYDGCDFTCPRINKQAWGKLTPREAKSILYGLVVDLGIYTTARAEEVVRRHGQ